MSRFGLEEQGIRNYRQAFWNLTPAALYEEAIRRAETCLEFATLEQALECAGTSRISAAGVIVTVMVDGEERIG